MSVQRQAQWAQRLGRLQTLREHFTRAGLYSRAHKAHLAVQRVYDRWADEVFALQR